MNLTHIHISINLWELPSLELNSVQSVIVMSHILSLHEQKNTREHKGLIQVSDVIRYTQV